jgi:DNA-binding transcriptional LysR family regulator
MDIKRMRHLVALSEERNFARAAERVHLSQPALSRSVRAAEGELGIALFDRGGVQVVPTPAGAFVLERVRKLLFDSRCLERDIDLYRKKLIGDAAFGTGPFPASSLLPRLLPEMRAAYPAVRIRVEVNNWAYLVQHLRREDLDFFVADVRDLPRDADLDLTMLARQRGGFYARSGHPLLAQQPLHPSALTAYGIATVRLPQVVRAAVHRLLGLSDEEPLPLALECDDVQVLKSAALGSDTVLASVHAAVAQETARGLLHPLELVGVPPLHTEMGVVSLRGRSHSPVAAHLIARLTALAQEIAIEMDENIPPPPDRRADRSEKA